MRSTFKAEFLGHIVAGIIVKAVEEHTWFRKRIKQRDKQLEILRIKNQDLIWINNALLNGITHEDLLKAMQERTAFLNIAKATK